MKNDLIDLSIDTFIWLLAVLSQMHTANDLHRVGWLLGGTRLLRKAARLWRARRLEVQASNT